MRPKTVTHEPVITPPVNLRVLIFGHLPNGEQEIAMAWLSGVDRQWYYAPQGGKINFTPAWWCHVPEPGS